MVDVESGLFFVVNNTGTVNCGQSLKLFAPYARLYVRTYFCRASSPENILIFYLKMVNFGAFWVALPRCM